MQTYDLVDLVDVLAGLGCRIGELLALDWTKVDADYLGHERVSMTQDVCMSRGVMGAAAVAALEQLALPLVRGESPL